MSSEMHVPFVFISMSFRNLSLFSSTVVHLDCTNTHRTLEYYCCSVLHSFIVFCCYFFFKYLYVSVCVCVTIYIFDYSERFRLHSPVCHLSFSDSWHCSCFSFALFKIAHKSYAHFSMWTAFQDIQLTGAFITHIKYEATQELKQQQLNR